MGEMTKIGSFPEFVGIFCSFSSDYYKCAWKLMHRVTNGIVFAKWNSTPPLQHCLFGQHYKANALSHLRKPLHQTVNKS